MGRDLKKKKKRPKPKQNKTHEKCNSVHEKKLFDLINNFLKLLDISQYSKWSYISLFWQQSVNYKTLFKKNQEIPQNVVIAHTHGLEDLF